VFKAHAKLDMGKVRPSQGVIMEQDRILNGLLPGGSAGVSTKLAGRVDGPSGSVGNSDHDVGEKVALMYDRSGLALVITGGTSCPPP
jgi:hypothetical protein